MFGKLIPPSLGLGIIRTQLESELNNHFKKQQKDTYVFVPVNAFKLVVDNLNTEVYFLVDGIKYPYNEGQQLSKLINHLIGEKVKEANIHLIVIDYSPEAKTVTTAFEQHGIKQQKHIVL